MSNLTAQPTGHERFFAKDEIIVSKTDLVGQITYANNVFLDIAGYTEEEVMGKPHNIIRHPDMPACVFKLLWDTIKAQQEIFAYVVNLAKNGDHYWVYAHVTPSYDERGKHIGYHSNRRVPYPDALEKVKALYAKLRAEEKKHSSVHAGMDASMKIVNGLLNDASIDYSKFVFSLSKNTTLENLEL